LKPRDHSVSEAGAGSDSSAGAKAQPVLHGPAGGSAVSAPAARSRAPNPFASLDAEETLVSPASRRFFGPVRGSDAETKTYEVPAELLALARATSRDRASRRASTPAPESPSVDSLLAVAEPQSGVISARLAPVMRSLIQRALALAESVRRRVPAWRSLLRSGFRRPGR
jgi:hypothetical protein